MKRMRVDRSPVATLLSLADIRRRLKARSTGEAARGMEAWSRLVPRFHQGVSLLPFLQSKGLSWHSLLGDGVSRRRKISIMAKCSDFKEMFIK